MGRRFDARKGGASPCVFTDCTFQEQHMQMNIQIECTAETLDQFNSPRFCLFVGKACSAHNVSRNGTVNNPYRFA